MKTAIRTETPDDETVVVTALVPASTDRVYRAFTDPAELARWWWPERFATTYEIDARPGGSFRVASSALPEDQSMGVHGTYLELSPTRLVLSWQWEGEEEITQVAIELEALDDVRTQVVVTHSANPSTDARDGHGQGWHDCLKRLVDYAWRRSSAREVDHAEPIALGVGEDHLVRVRRPHVQREPPGSGSAA